jgi:hypothetical protein
MLRIDEVLGLEFESIDMLPPVRECVPASNAFSPTEKWKLLESPSLARASTQ